MLVLLALLLAPFELDAVVDEMERAVIRGERETLESVVSELEQAIDAVGEKDAVTLRHAFAYASWRLAGFEKRGSKPYKQILKRAEKALKQVLEADPEHAEARALNGTVQGWLVTGMWSGMRRGPRADKEFKRARELAPDNPRVAMHQGVSRLFRPGAFGGGLDKAETELTEAMELFDREAPGGPWPNRGRAEILGWMGQVMYRKGELDKAREFYERALALEPDYDWVHTFLIPQLERKMGASKKKGSLEPIDKSSGLRDRGIVLDPRR